MSRSSSGLNLNLISDACVESRTQSILLDVSLHRMKRAVV